MIRPYNQADKEKLLELFKLNTPKYFDEKEILDYEDYLKQHGDTYLTIEHSNEIVGGAGYMVNEADRSGSITWIFFDPDYSGKGLGREVVKHCHEILRNDERVEKFTVRTSQLAYGFFEKFGYKTTNIEKHYWAKGLDLYEMETPR